MRIKSLISLLAVACLLMVTISPLFARNTPFPVRLHGDQAHPWQDDDQLAETEVSVQFTIPVGPIVITISIPAEWIGVNLDKSKVVSRVQARSARTAKPMSLNQKGDTR